MTSTAPTVVLRIAGSHNRTVSHDVVAPGLAFPTSCAERANI